MTTAGVHVVAALALLVLPGYLPARALVGSTPLAVALAPLVTGVACTVGAVAALASGAALGLCVGVVLAVVTAASLARLRRWSPDGRAVSWARLTVLAAAAAIPLLAVQRAPVDWDARSIWFFHADWLRVGGSAAADAFGNPSFAFSHGDYPPLVPATVAAVWTVLGRDLDVAQLVTALLGASAVVAMVLALGAAARRLVPDGRPRWWGLTLPLVVLAAYGMAGVGGTNGYVDLVWSAAFAAGAIGLLVGGPERDATAMGALCLAAAMLTKNEGMAAGVVVLGLVVLTRGWRRGIAVAAVPAALAVIWVLTSRALGAESDLAAGGGVSGLLRLDGDVVDRFGPTLAAMWRWCRWELVVAALLTAVALLVPGRHHRELGGSAVRAWAAVAGCLTTIVLAYVVSPNDIDWHLSTSVERTTLAPRLLLLLVATLGIAVIASWWRSRPAGPAGASDPAPKGGRVVERRADGAPLVEEPPVGAVDRTPA